MLRLADIDQFVENVGRCVLVQVAKAQGSVPREAGTWMLVSAASLLGTIGGGQLEFLAIDHARKMLVDSDGVCELDIPLGPDIGQCCGGRVLLQFRIAGSVELNELYELVEADAETFPHVFIFGAGHVGLALATAMLNLPFKVSVVDMRRTQFNQMDARITQIVSPMPEAIVRDAPQKSAFVAVTHDHAQDFMITREALLRADAGYVGMIGSKTKRAQFDRWFLDEAGELSQLQHLICPIGGDVVKDKRPEIIAALTCAEIIGSMGRLHLTDSPISQIQSNPQEGS